MNGFSIGTANETSLHAAVKNWLDPDPAHQEVRLGAHIADVYNGEEIFEVQTRGLYRLREKARQLLAWAPVTVVYPAAACKRIYWIDPQTGSCSGGRRGSRPASPYTLWRELPGLAELFGTPGFSVRMLLIEVDEYRLLDGFGAQKKRRATHVDRVLRGIRADFTAAVPQDLLRLIPEPLPEPFTSRGFAAAAHIPLPDAQSALTMLTRHELVSRTRAGHGYLYARRFSPAPGENLPAQTQPPEFII